MRKQIEHLRDHGTLPPEEPVAAVELAKEEPAAQEPEALPILEKAGSPSINNEVIGKQQDPTVEDLPKDSSSRASKRY